ncbi:unnamed protein product [Caenorhabditis bovis]|uniref:BHLH domain-containing protein n=1 Tax=Caenorhabditis bovis TaxID=2654633 RepID=A0A8S1F9L3_9PELO|nr:unnamed protein product [Caenorhabditis bovis]
MMGSNAHEPVSVVVQQQQNQPNAASHRAIHRRGAPVRRRIMSTPAKWSAGDEQPRKVYSYVTVTRVGEKTPSPPLIKTTTTSPAATVKRATTGGPYRPVTIRKFVEKQRNSPPSDGSDKIRRFGESPTNGSFNNDLDEFIIDDILGWDDEQQRRTSGSNGTRPMSVGLSNETKPLSQMSMARPIPGSSRGSGHSGSPIGIPNAISNNFRHVVSSSAPTSSIDVEKMMGVTNGSSGDGEEYYRDRRKKDIHNMIERRRRYNINDRIKELGQMLPKASAEDMKLNKGTILKASCDYIRTLQKDREMMMKQHQNAKSLETAAKQYADRVKELEEMLARQGVQVPPSQLPPIPRLLDRPIKQEIEENPSPPTQTPTGSFISTSGFLSEVTNNTAAMQIASPHGDNRGNGAFSAQSDSFFSVGSASPPDYRTNWKMQQHNNFPDLMMDDINNMTGNGLLNGADPLISAAGAHPSPHFGQSQMSPDIQWDASGFSPEPTNGQQSGNNGYNQMDYS